MKNINTPNYDFDYNKNENNQGNKIIEKTKDEIFNTLDNKNLSEQSKEATKQLAEIFGLNNEQILSLSRFETNNLSDENEINKTEAQLGAMFGKYDELIALENKKPLSLASVMEQFENELQAA